MRPTLAIRCTVIAASLTLAACGGTPPAAEDVTDRAAGTPASATVAAGEHAAATTGRCTTTAEMSEQFPDDVPIPEGFGFRGGTGGVGGYWELTGCLLHAEASTSLRDLVDVLLERGWRVESEQLEPIDGDTAVRLIHDDDRYYDVQVIGEPANGIVHLKIGLSLSTG